MRREWWALSSILSNAAMKIVTGAGIASNASNSLDRIMDWQAKGLSQRQAAHRLEGPRPTLHAWRAWQDRLDACPQVGEFFESVPGLAFLHRLVLAFHVMGQEAESIS